VIGIVDYGSGNLASVRNALDYLDIPNDIIANPDTISHCDRLLLPGVGAFGQAMEQLRATGMQEAVLAFADSGKPLLGICLGMQLLFSQSHELGVHEGLGLIPGEVRPLAGATTELNVPNIGWCKIEGTPDSLLLNSIPDEERCYYFVHSFYCKSNDRQAVTGTLEYGTSCDVVVESGNVFGCQFHPEKSQKAGLAILQNFWEAQCS